MRILIVADDLTGAADSAARCHHAGWPATIFLQSPSLRVPPGVIALTSDSRHLPAVVAAHRVRELVAGLSTVGEVLWYKKIDSTLRGNIGSELDAMLDVLGQRYAMVAPAFPAQGRGLNQGYLSSEVALASSLHLPTLLQQQSRRAITTIPLSDVRLGPQHLAAQLASVQQHETQLIVVDGMTEADLRTILVATQASLPNALLCGSAGLINILAAAYRAATASHAVRTPPNIQSVGSGPTLLLVGSGSPVAHDQIRYLRRRGEIAMIEVGSDQPVPTDRDILVHLPSPAVGTTVEGPTARALVARLAETALAIMNQQRPGLLVLTGGDTAITFLSCLGIRELRVMRELLPGMPLTWGIDQAGNVQRVILKAGNHGDEAALHTVLQQARYVRVGGLCMQRETRPLLAITMGDPAGIGPEVVLKALSHHHVYQHYRPLVIGDRRILQRAAAWLDQPPSGYDLVDDPAHGRYEAGTISVLDLANADPEACPPGQVSADAGRAAVEYVFKACDLALALAVDAVVTAPLNKDAMNRAGFAYAGHTELLAERTGAERVSMLLIGPQLRIVHVSTHVSLQEAIRRVTQARVEEVITLAHQSCLALGIDAPRIAVAGLNPHASEDGLFGDEEQREIMPAISATRARGLDVSNPQPPDTIFLRAVKGEFDIVVAMYHDQGHIPMKLLAFDSGVNVSIGLPIVRTSVDHGTAFDIAGSGRASEQSLLAAMEVAVQMVHARHAEQAGSRRGTAV